MEQLIKMVTEKAGISSGQATEAVKTVIHFLKDKMPGGLGEQVESFITGNHSGTGGGMGGDIAGKIGGMFK